MIVAAIVWGAPEWLWPAVGLSVGALAVLVWGYWRAQATLRLRSCVGLLKLLGILVLVLCLIEPFSSSTRPRPGANLFVLLADDSQSLEIRDPGSDRTRAQILKDHFDLDARWHERLSQGFDVRHYSFAERLRSVDDEEQLTGAGGASSLVTALRTVSRRFQGRPLAGVLLLTDGNATDLPDEAVDWSEMPPIYPVPIGTAAGNDIRIGQIAVSQTNFEQAPVTIRADIAAKGYDGQDIVVQLLDTSGEELQRQIVVVEEADKPRIVRFQLRPKRSGVSFYRLRASAESELEQFQAPERSVEATLANNDRLAVVERPKGPYRVLYVAGRPNWEFKFLRRALAEDKDVEMVGLIRVALREPKYNFLGRAGESSNPIFRGFDPKSDEETGNYDQPVLIRIDTQDESGAELRDGFPKTADELYVYDAVILDDIEAEFFTPDQMLLLQKFVSVRGGGLLILGGAESLWQGKYHRTPVGELLPVYLGRQAEEPGDTNYRLSLSREGWLQPWVRLRETEFDERRRLQSMNEFDTLNRIRGIKPGATVLANVTDEGGGIHPALVAQRFGRGRTATLLIGDMWKWHLKRKEGEESDLAKAWRQMVRWMLADVPERVQLEARRGQGGPTAPVELRVTVRDAEFQPMDNATVDLLVTTPDGKTQKLRAEAGDKEAGTYVATYVSREGGAYRAKAVVAAPDGSDVGEEEAGWTAEPVAREFTQLEPNLALLEEIARETGGEVIMPDRLDRFVADLPNRKMPITEPWIYPLWHHPLVFLLAVALISSEWGIRRWRGLP